MQLHIRAIALAAALSALGLAPVCAQTASQVVTFSVVPASRVALYGSVSPLRVSTAKAGSAPTSASVAGATYAITTNETNQKISASLSKPMPAGVSLAVSLGAPSGAASAGATSLGTSATDVVTGISAVSASALPIVYTLNASTGASVVSGTRLVTYTITAGQ